jgi:hypothetical protein
MSSSIEKMNHAEHDEIRSPKDVKKTLNNNARMFVCEEHVTLWITPQKRKTGTK